jgi:hypothetical protein
MQPSSTRWMIAGFLVLFATAAFAAGPVPAVTPVTGKPGAATAPDAPSWLTPKPVQKSGTACTIRCLSNPAHACTSEVGDCYLGPTTLYCDGAPYNCPCDPLQGPCDGPNPWV